MKKLSSIKYILSFATVLYCGMVAAQTHTHHSLHKAHKKTAAQPTTAAQVVHAVLTANSQAVLSSRIAGYVTAFPVKEGGRFKKGDILVKLDCTIHNLQLKKAQALLNESLAEYQANKKLARLDALNKTELTKSKAKLDAAYAEVAIKKQQVRFCVVKAPFNGRMIELKVNRYENVPQNQPLVEVLDNSNLSIELIVPSNWLIWLKEKQAFTFKVKEMGKTYSAHLEKMSPKVDAVSKSVHLFGKLDKRYPHLVAGMSGKAYFFPSHQHKNTR